MKKFELSKCDEGVELDVVISAKRQQNINIKRAGRGIDDDYLITFYEGKSKLWEEYGNADYIEDTYGIIVC